MESPRELRSISFEHLHQEGTQSPQQPTTNSLSVECVTLPVQDNSPTSFQPLSDQPISTTQGIDISRRPRRGHRHHQRRRHHHHRSRHHDRRSGDLRFAKTLLHFSAAHILLGIACVVLQMVQFTNHSILSEAQPGLWCGTFFVITGSVCLGLAKTRGLYSTIAMLCFCLVSLFMSLTLASLSWFGAEAASCCQDYWSYNCVENKPNNYLNRTTTTTNFSPTTPSEEYSTTTESVLLLTSSANNNTINTCYGPIENGPSCQDIKYGYCGYDIGLGRTLHLLLLVAGVIGATTSFVLSTLACSRPSNQSDSGRNRPRLSSIFAISGSDHVQSSSNRPITAWEYPPPSKDVELARTPGIEEQYPNDPPPPYEEQDDGELQSQL